MSVRCLSQLQGNLRPVLSLLAFSIIAKAHFGLSETDCVFPLANAIELFQLGLVDTLYIRISKISNGKGMIGNNRGESSEMYLTGEVDFNGLDANVLGLRCHIGHGVYIFLQFGLSEHRNCGRVGCRGFGCRQCKNSGSEAGRWSSGVEVHKRKGELQDQ